MTTIKEARLKAGLTQEELAMKSGVKLSTLQKLERGVNSMNGATAETVLRLARALGVTVEDLVTIEW
mgnify:FL=1